MGPKDAPVTWVVFGGWECPFSGRLPPLIEALHEAYPETLRIVFKHVAPSHAKVGSIVAKRLLMTSQETFWTVGMKWLEKSPITEISLQELEGIPPLTDEQETEARIRLEMDRELALSLGIRSTPQSVINGYRLTGVKPLETFKKIIDEELARSKEQRKP